MIICPLSVVVDIGVVVVVVVNFSHIHILLQNHWANFNQTWYKVSLSEWDSSLFKWRGDNNKIAKIHWQIYKIFSRTTGPISTEFSTNHPLCEEMLSLFKWRARPIPTVENYEIEKLQSQNLKIFFFRITGQISNYNLAQIVLGWSKFEFVQINGPSFSKGR